MASHISSLVLGVDSLLPYPLAGEGHVVVGENDNGEVVITLDGIGTDDQGHLVRNLAEYEVEGTVTIPVRVRVQAESDRHARGQAESAIIGVAVSVDNNYIDDFAGLDAGYSEDVRLRETTYDVGEVREV